MDQIEVALKRLPHAEELALPKYETEYSAGMDLRAAISRDEPVEILPGDRAVIPTGLQIALPPGYEGQIRSRSGIAIRNGVTVLNSPGTIDSDYRGEVMVILVNLGEDLFTVRRGERVAQFIITKHERAVWKEKKELEETARGPGGLGHTGRS